jgi:hypothetical protein
MESIWPVFISVERMPDALSRSLGLTALMIAFSAKYSISKQALWHDWQKRTQWVYDAFKLEPVRIS